MAPAAKSCLEGSGEDTPSRSGRLGFRFRGLGFRGLGFTVGVRGLA